MCTAKINLWCGIFRCHTTLPQQANHSLPPSVGKRSLSCWQWSCWNTAGGAGPDSVSETNWYKLTNITPVFTSTMWCANVLNRCQRVYLKSGSVFSKRPTQRHVIGRDDHVDQSHTCLTSRSVDLRTPTLWTITYIRQDTFRLRSLTCWSCHTDTIKDVMFACHWLSMTMKWVSVNQGCPCFSKNTSFKITWIMSSRA